MKTLVGFAGKLGSGKNYCMNQMVNELKDTGHTIYQVSFADPIKKILKDSFGLTKAGKTDKKFPEFTELYVKGQVIDSTYKLIKNLKYEKFDISEADLKAYISRNYEKYETVFYGNVSGASKTDDPKYYAKCFRKLGQMLGTELGRYLIDSIWVDIALDKVKKVFKQDLADYAFIADVRFKNEYNFLKDFNTNTAFDSVVYGVTASNETRAKRRGLSLEELLEQDSHGSEQEVDEIISSLDEKFVIANDHGGE